MALVGLGLLFLREKKQDAREALPRLSASDITEMLHYGFCTPTNAETVEQ